MQSTFDPLIITKLKGICTIVSCDLHLLTLKNPTQVNKNPSRSYTVAMAGGAIRYCVAVQKQLMLARDLTRTARVINHAAQVGLSTLVSVQVRRVACCDQFCMFHTVMCSLSLHWSAGDLKEKSDSEVLD